MSCLLRRSPLMTTAIVLVAGLLAGCPSRPVEKATSSTPPEATRRPGSLADTLDSIQLVDRTAQSGIDFMHTDGSSGKRLIMETISCGLALLDYDGDGLIDIYFCNGAALPGSVIESAPRHALYKNLGGLRFRDVSEQAGIACTAFGLGVAAGDYNNDGWPDIYLSNFGANVLYANNGDGTFSDDTPSAVGRGERVGAGACFLDVEGDGDLDLLAANYVQFSLADHRTPKEMGRTVYPGPLDYPPETNTLLRNEGDGRWTDVSQPSGIAAREGTGMGTVCADFDEDGDTDIYVANDEMPNFLYQNDGHGGFEEVAVLRGAAYDAAGLAHGSMGVDCGDVDNDGRLDMFVTAYQYEMATLYRNATHGMFQDVTRVWGAGEGTLPHVTWGCCIADLDNDGDRDLYVACGHLDDRNENDYYRAPNLVLKNLLAERGRPAFVDVSARCGDVPRLRHSSRGAAVDDLDNDGDLDVVVLNSRQSPTLLENLSATESGRAMGRTGLPTRPGRERSYEGSPVAGAPSPRQGRHHWLQVQLRGVRANRDGVGARVRIVAGPLSLVDEVHSGRGYQSHWGSRLHFGLGSQARAQRIEVRWIGGGTTVLQDVAADQLVTIRESSE